MTGFNDLTNTKVGNYEEGLADRIADRTVRDVTFGRLLPDSPTGDVVYVNPALTPSPTMLGPRKELRCRSSMILD
jgi:hypothetical protein